MNKNLISNAEENLWYRLDPDNRKKPPKNGLHCCRCMMPVKGSAGNSFISVEVKEIEPNSVCLIVRKNPLGTELIGEDCWKKITELKPCPFCGCAANVESPSPRGRPTWRVICSGWCCDIADSTRKEAVKRWNTRINNKLSKDL